ncbi:hypothetical protein [Rhodococcus marinonascens]|uniref:hypothetical protein n=1 Tax=Rhodococcus marinonascens TaxID=38311 RepID=UPI0009323F48|nr:hypothetical protein [Rhodococcus marinonascens]
MKTRRLVLSVIGGVAISMVAVPAAQADTNFDFLPPEISNLIPSDWTDPLNLMPPPGPEQVPGTEQVQDFNPGPEGTQDFQPRPGSPPQGYVQPEGGPQGGPPGGPLGFFPEIGPGGFGPGGFGNFGDFGGFGGFGDGFLLGPGFGGFF